MHLIITSYSLGNFFGREFPIYGACYLGGIFLGGLVALLLAKKRKFDPWEIVYSAGFAVVGGIIGAKLLSVLTNLPLIVSYLQNGGSLYEVIKNGFVFYGGLVGGVGGLFIYTKAYKLSFAEYADFLAPAVAVGHSLGRIGCLFAGCCYGRQVAADFPLTVQYAFVGGNSHSLVTEGAYYIPTQLMESVFLLVLFGLCLLFFFRGKKKGTTALAYGFGYSLWRFFLEFLRGDTARGIYFGLSTSQYISVLCFVFCLIAVFRRARKFRKAGLSE